MAKQCPLLALRQVSQKYTSGILSPTVSTSPSLTLYWGKSVL